jgi:hypothetical protein
VLVDRRRRVRRPNAIAARQFAARQFAARQFAGR